MNRRTVLALQRWAGNRAVTSVLMPPGRDAEVPVITRMQPRDLIARQDETSPAPATAKEKEPGVKTRYEPTDEDKKEYSLLPKNIKTAAARGIKSLDEYIAYRHTYFGSAEKYAEAKKAADAEFDSMKKGTWNRIGQRESKDTKRILYRWLRKAYVDKGISDPVAMIKSGKTPDLKKKLAAIEESHPSLKTGGFVARPVKLKGYRLGTVSEHGTGKAIDVKPQSKNPQLKKKEWAWLESFVGRKDSIDRSRSRWKKDPAGLWQDIQDLNAAYVKELRGKIAALEAERAKAGESKDETPAFEEVLAGQSTLLKAARSHGVDHGFFDLEKDVVVDFAKQGFIWGATFSSNVDLHHFEIK